MTEPSDTLFDIIAEALDNSMDVDWSSSVGAQYVIDALEKIGVTDASLQARAPIEDMARRFRAAYIVVTKATMWPTDEQFLEMLTLISKVGPLPEMAVESADSFVKENYQAFNEWSHPEELERVEDEVKVMLGQPDWLVDREILAQAAADPCLSDASVRALCTVRRGAMNEEVKAWVEKSIGNKKAEMQ